jgi:hypothetical protein
MTFHNSQLLGILVPVNEPSRVSAAMSDEDRREWEIRIVREAIDRDWAWLASHNLSTEQRRAVREHLSVHVTALRELAERHRLALQSVRQIV